MLVGNFAAFLLLSSTNDAIEVANFVSKLKPGFSKKQLTDRVFAYSGGHNLENYKWSGFVHPVQNSRNWIFPLELRSGKAVQVLAVRKGNRFTGEILRDEAMDVLSNDAVMIGNCIFLSTTFYVLSNAPMAGHRVLQRQNGAWKNVLEHVTGIESYGGRVRKTRHGWSVTQEGQTYPENFSVCHALAQLWKRQTFTWNGNRVTSGKAQPIPSAMSTFNDLLGAKFRGDFAGVRRLSSNHALAKRIYDMKSLKIDEDSWSAESSLKGGELDNFSADSIVFSVRKSSGRYLLLGISKTKK